MGPMLAYPSAPSSVLRARSLRPVLRCAAAALALCCGWGSALAQPAPSVARPVVQPLPGRDSLQLNAALSRLGRDPRDLGALVDAGNAAMAMGDVDAAVGFFRRADQVSPRDPRVKAGLGGAMVRNGDPISAIGLFDDAEQAGAPVVSLAADRGLAHDLVGDNATAQRLYRLVLARGNDDEVTRRLAVSLAISGDKRTSEAVLLPLLRQQDKAAWRVRTFALAILGDPEDAIRTAKTILPEGLAENMAPYLRYMPRLTKAQQASAALLGSFPRASEIGRDDPRIAQFAGTLPVVRVAAADTPLVPKGEPLGKATRASRQAAQRSRPAEPLPARAAAAPAAPATSSAPAAAAVPAPAAATRTQSPPTRMAATIVPSTNSAIPSISAIADGSGQTRARAATPSAAAGRTSAAPQKPPVAASPAAVPARPQAQVPATTRASAGTAAAPASQPGFDLARMPQPPVPAPSQPVPVAAAPAQPRPSPAPAQAAPAARVSLAEAFSDLGTPASTAPHVTDGAVDISRIAPKRPKPEAKAGAVAPTPPEPGKTGAGKASAAKPPAGKAAKPAPPSHPSRIWVQIGVGRDKAALATDWKRISRQAAAPFKARKPFVSEMGRTNRMLVGPFDSAAQANKFIAELKGAGLSDPYVWTSPAGQVVDALATR